MKDIIGAIFTTHFLFTVLRLTTPLIFAALSALIARAAGIRNITIEGTMLMTALTGVLVSAYTRSLPFAVACALLAGVLMGFLLAYFHLKLDTDILLSGIAINMVANGGTVFLLYVFAGDKGSSERLTSQVLPTVELPLIRDIPVLGEVLSGHNVLTYVAFGSVFLVWFLMFKTPVGLRIRAVGEYPEAIESVGKNATAIKLFALALSGFFAALGGIFLSMGYMNFFVKNMAAGRGFIGVAADYMGGGNPFGALAASLLFGIADACANTMQTMSIPAELVLCIPYGVTILGLVLSAAETKRLRCRQKKKALQSLRAGGEAGKP